MEEKAFSDTSYEQFLGQDKLMGSKCKECSTLFLPPRPICTKCRGIKMEWVRLEGKGKLITFTCITVGPPSTIREGYDRQHPYCVGVVELEEGVRVDARVEGVDVSRPEAIKIGTPVTVKFLHKGEQVFLAFKPAK